MKNERKKFNVVKNGKPEKIYDIEGNQNKIRVLTVF